MCGSHPPPTTVPKTLWPYSETPVFVRGDVATVTLTGLNRSQPPRMHGMMGTPPQAAGEKDIASSRIMLLLLVAMTGVAPISLYMLVPALPILATTFGDGIS